MMQEEIELKKDTWWVLQKIKKKLDKNKKSDAILFRIQILPPDLKTPPPNKQYRALWNLGKNEGLFRFTKFVQDGTITPVIGIDEYEITVSREKLNEVYKRYAKEAEKISENTATIQEKQEPIETTASSWKQGLERRFIFNVLTEIDEAIFFRWIADYVKFVIESPPLRAIVEKDISEEENKDHQKLNELKDKVQKELDDTALKLRDAIQKHKIPMSAALREVIDEYNGFKVGRNISSRHTPLNEYGALCGILRVLLEEGYSNVVRDFAKIHTSTQPVYIEEYTFSPTATEFKNELEYLKERQEHTVWGSWKELYIAYLVIHQKREVLEEIKLTDNTLLALDFGVIVGEMNEILEKKDRHSRKYGFVQFIKGNYILHINRVHHYLLERLKDFEPSQPQKNRLKSIHLVTYSLEPKDVIFLVLDEQYTMPIRFAVKNKEGHPTYIKKLYDIAYTVNAPGKKVDYDKRVADCINNGLFRKKQVKKYMRTNRLEKPTLVQKSKDNTLVLKNEIPVYTILVKNIPSQYQSLYIDKTR